jgi:methionyl-tRNA synthetase
MLLPADYWRFALISLRPEASDVNFGWDSFSEKVNNDLNDTIGNFVNRTLVGVSKFANNNFDLKLSDIAEEFRKRVVMAQERHALVKELFEKVELQSACRTIIEQGYDANRFLSSTEPWKVIKRDRQSALQIIYVALLVLKLLASELYPIIPETSLKIARQSGIFKNNKGIPAWSDISLENDLPIVTTEVQPIFSKVRAEELRNKLAAVRSSR